MRRLIFSLGLLLGACAPMAPENVSRAASAATVAPDVSPPLGSRFGAPQPVAPRAANTAIARDFLDLAFSLESGRALPVLTRFEGPVTLRVAKGAPPSLAPDLARLLRRLREEAGIDITEVDGSAANITLVPVPRRSIRRELPQAACFVVPGVSSWAEFRRAQRAGKTSWTDVRERRTAAVFLPVDAAPQELRDCLHEEIAQALGPLNDLYRLGESVFNDDNIHTVLTGYDMLVLRAFYDPALRSGMDRAEVAAVLPTLLARLNPAGETMPDRHLPATSRPWIEAIQTALGSDGSLDLRRAAAEDALRLARAEGWRDHRLGFAHFALGRLLSGSDPDAAEAEFRAARRVFAALPDARLHEAYAAAQLAALALRMGRPEDALELTLSQEPVARRHENAALLASLMTLRAEALRATNRGAEADAVRLDSLGWARYGFGPDWDGGADLRRIAALDPAQGS
ncbi:DUF2927 domain-containing protein [Salipiger mangrovisoli]|uniref:DUF2927 domain-containing protein n=1 Tax=Salipiger mangrovisoli TaxID=2865933 RepID=A0ABR9X047_9RHOB|nr:DUF2927 domain-containing protein [Salipiger mangrovisoli]MBE9636924.1 DUF2927 domain-containing protein [Salipiger mangrovisoli]